MALLKRADLARFQKYIENGDYMSAIKVANKFGLDKDDVYKPQWNASDFGTEAIQNVLSRVEDAMWVVKECKDRVCPSFDAMNALLSCGLKFTERYGYPERGFSSLEGGAANDKAWWFRYKRLRLLQYKDRLDTFVGINNGRYSQNEYEIFRAVPLHKVALGFAERGKTGALALLVKRHTYSLAPYILQLLDAIPEPLPPQTYGQLLPNVAPPKPLLPRNSEDWVEKDEILKAVKTARRGLYQGEKELGLEDSTEYMVKLSKGLLWPTKVEIVDWYKERAREIDRSCGLLENSLALLDLGVGKGLTELETYFEDVSDLYGVVFSSDTIDSEVNLMLSDWESLSKYERFKVILNGANEETAVDRLREQGVPYMIRNETLASPVTNKAIRNDSGAHEDMDSQTFLVQWLKEKAKENKLSVCSAILAECCREQGDSSLFSSDEELVEVVLYCIYACSRTDEWTLMSSMLGRIPRRELKAKEASTIVEDVQGARNLRKGFMNAFRGAVGGKTSDVQLAMAPVTVNVDDIQPVLHRSRDVLGNYLSETVEGQVRQAERHVEAGKLLLQYQVPKPIAFFLVCKEDVNGTKQLLRILLLKFSNREPAKSDIDWAHLWQNLRLLQEKVFPFLDKEFLLSELCQGMLKAGKFSLATSYLKGTGTTILRPEKAEKLVLNAAREYFYSSPDLDSSSSEAASRPLSELISLTNCMVGSPCMKQLANSVPAEQHIKLLIGKAKQCLNLLPPSKALIAEINLIDAITERLPSLGVNLYPVQFRQLKDSMEVIKMAISSQAGGYLNIPEIMELARLLGLSSLDDTLAIEAAIAREAAAAGDFVLALDMCLGLVKNGHGPIWDLCAALGRGPDFDQMDLDTRKELIGFALGHCDEDSVGELLNAWKEFNILSSCDLLGRMVGRSAVSLAEHERATASLSERLDSRHDAISSNEKGEEDSWWQGGRRALSCVIADDNQANEQSWQSFAKEKKKALGFVCLHLPWLVEVSSGKTPNKLESIDTRAQDGGLEGGSWIHNLPKECRSPSAQAVALILHALATNDIVANDNLVLRLAQEAMSRPVSKEGDTVGCGYLLNLSDSHLGAKLLEVELERREDYEEAHQALEWALSFSTLQASVLGLRSPKGRRDILIQTLRVHKCTDQGFDSQDGPVKSFWSEFSIKAAEILRVAEESRRLRKLLPDVDVGRFISGDDMYIQEKIFSHLDSVKTRQEKLLPNMLTLADLYNVEQWQIFQRYFLALVEADWTSEEEILTEITGFWARLLVDPDRLLDTIEVYEQVTFTALEGLRKEGSGPGSDKKALLVYKSMLVRALVSLSSDAASVKGESVSSGLPELNTNDMLYRVRYSVWQKLCQFADDLQAPLHCRIYILELLEAIRNGKVPRQDFWPSGQLGDEDLMISWGKWEAEGGDVEFLKHQVEIGGEKNLNIGCSVNVLLALRSTHIISSHWPGWEVTSTDLSSPEDAASFFNRLLEGTTSIGHAEALKALLEEWESVFGFGHWQGEVRQGAARNVEEKADWAGEDWGEGWDEFGEDSWTVHTLHSCWKSTLQKLTELGGLRRALGVLDAALLHPTSVLVTEGEAKDLVAAIGLSNPSAALQLSLLLPYNSSQVHGLQLLEEQLNLMHDRSSGPEESQIIGGEEEGRLQTMSQSSDVVNQDLMALMLSSGLLPSAANDPMVFSALCGFLGHLALQVQELQLSIKPSLNEFLVSVDNVPLCAVAFPFFVAELTKSKHYGQAGALVLQFMRVHPALATWNAASMALQRYLSTQVDGASVDSITTRGNNYLGNQVNFLQLNHLRNTVQSVTCRLEELLKSALKAFSKDMK